MRISRIALSACLAFALAAVAAGQQQQQQQGGQSRQGGTQQPRRRVAVTFDDLPMSGDDGRSTAQQVLENSRRIVAALVEHKIPAVGFVNERRLGEGAERELMVAALRAWTEAGLELGNHTYSHKSLHRTPLAEFREEVIRGEPVTRALLAERGRKLRYFRHPFLNTGPTLAVKRDFEKFLAERGYTVAPVTHDNMEWVFAREYAAAVAAGDSEKARRVADEYAPYMESLFEFYERLSVELFGREIPQILLVHANQLNGDHFRRVIEVMRRRGYEFVTLDEAMSDAAYRHEDTYVGPVGISWLQRWLVTRGRPFRKEPYLPEYMRQFDPAYSGSDFKTRKGK